MLVLACILLVLRAKLTSKSLISTSSLHILIDKKAARRVG
jgi:hypothetical protein